MRGWVFQGLSKPIESRTAWNHHGFQIWQPPDRAGVTIGLPPLLSPWRHFFRFSKSNDGVMVNRSMHVFCETGSISPNDRVHI